MSLHEEEKMRAAAHDAALRLAEEIAAGAIRHEGMAAFHGAYASPQAGQPDHWRVFAGDYYEGSAGIGRLLACASVHGAGKKTADTAVQALRHALARTEGWSLHSGGMGTGLAVMEAAGLLERPDLADTGEALCEASADQALEDAASGTAPLDFLAGLAGVLHACVHLASAAPDKWTGRARQLAGCLAAAAVAQTPGKAWPILPGEQVLLCGLAHGAAGPALALEEFAMTGGGSQYSELADEARLFERTHFSAAHCSWADLRTDAAAADRKNTYPHFWCHGSIGIAHDRLTAHLHRPNCPLLSADAAAALMGARREAGRVLAGPCGPGADYLANASQCHGLSGLIDLLVSTGMAHDHSLALRLAAFVREDSRRAAGWRTGLHSGAPTPGLMLGLAGVAWGQLRTALPDKIPPAWTPAGSIQNS